MLRKIRKTLVSQAAFARAREGIPGFCSVSSSRRRPARAAAAALLALLLALPLASPPVAAQPAAAPAVRQAAPALWRIDGPRGAVYLFGTFHLLPPQTQWRSPEIDAALGRAHVIVLEIDYDQARNASTMAELAAKHGLLPPGESLDRLLPPPVNAALARRAADFGVPPEAFAPMRPWLAGLTLAVQFIVREGFDPNLGIDMTLGRLARANAKRLAALETAEAQVRVFADLTRAEEVQFLDVTLRQLDEAPALLGRMLGAYLTADLATLERTLNLGLDEAPALRKRLLRDRHERWLPQIERMVADGPTHFVAVGAGHLVGSDSLVAMLRARGVKVVGP